MFHSVLFNRGDRHLGIICTPASNNSTNKVIGFKK